MRGNGSTAAAAGRRSTGSSSSGLYAWLALLVFDYLPVKHIVGSRAGLGATPQASFVLSSVAYVHWLALTWVAVMAVTLAPRLRAHVASLRAASARHEWRPYFFLHVVVFACVLWASRMVFSPASALLGSAVGAAFWLVLVFGLILTWLLCAAPPMFWRGLLSRERRALAAVSGVTVLIVLFGWAARALYEPLHVFTLDAVYRLLRLVSTDVSMDPAQFHIETHGFGVEVGAPCSGYEGMALITGMIGCYLAVYRQELRFPQALSLLPLGVVLIGLANLLRLCSLILIGAYLSPGIALGGFHSKAGWIAFIAVSGGLIYASHRIPWFRSMAATSPWVAAPAVPEASDRRFGETSVFLLPLVTLLGTAMLSSAFIAHFDWAYPLRVMTTGAVLWWFSPQYRLRADGAAWMPLLLGAASFGAWLLLVPAQPELNAQAAAALARVSAPLRLGWVAARVLGAVVVVPLAEELAFRGYLLAWLSGRRRHFALPLRASAPAVIVSSVLFGLLHSAILAGSIAGLAFALARLWRGRLADAVLAHACTNGLLAAYVLYTGQWCYW